MPETSSLLSEKYGADISELAQNNLYVHGTTKPKLLGTSFNGEGILKEGLKNGVSVSEDTLARNVMYSTAVRYGGSGINGVLIFYDPPKGTLNYDHLDFPPPTTKVDSFSDEQTLGAEHIAFWLETQKSGISSYVENALDEMLRNTSNNEDVIGIFVDELAQLIAEHALVPNTTEVTEFTEENIEETHSTLDIDTATARACEILWNALSEKLFTEISNLEFFTKELLRLKDDEEETQYLFRLLTGQEREVNTTLRKTEYVSSFIKLWKQFKNIQLPYDLLQEEVRTRMQHFHDRASELEIWLTNMLREVDDYKIKEEKKRNSVFYKINRKIRKIFQPKKRI